MKLKILDQEDDPRAALIKKLIEYEKFKNASIELSSFTIHGRDNSKVCLEISKTEPEMPQVSIEMINETIHKIVKRITFKPHRIDFEKLSVRERMSYLIEKIYFRKIFILKIYLMMFFNTITCCNLTCFIAII